MNTLLLVWYASGWANAAVFAICDEKLHTKGLAIAMALGLFMLICILGVAPLYPFFNDTVIWQKKPR